MHFLVSRTGLVLGCVAIATLSSTLILGESDPPAVEQHPVAVMLASRTGAAPPAPPSLRPATSRPEPAVRQELATVEPLPTMPSSRGPSMVIDAPPRPGIPAPA